MFLIGNGFDCHEIIDINKGIQTNSNATNVINSEDINYLTFGGIKIYKKNKRFKAHSDGDVIIHAIIDSLLSPVFNIDIGMIFPDKNLKYKNMNSFEMLKITKKLIDGNRNYLERLEDSKIKKAIISEIEKKSLLNKSVKIINIDITVVCDQIKVIDYKEKIIDKLNSVFPETYISIKGKTTEDAFKENYCYVWVNSLIELA